MSVFWEWLWPTLTAAGFALIGFFGHALFVRVRDAAANRAAGDILRDAQRAPYSLAGISRCDDFRRSIRELDIYLGPDVDAVDEKGDALYERLAEAGAKSVVNAFIPFRGLVREATGAAEADRRFRTMVAAGMARRGFLKGIARERKCAL